MRDVGFGSNSEEFSASKLGLLGSLESTSIKKQVIAAITDEQPPFTPEVTVSRTARVSVPRCATANEGVRPSLKVSSCMGRSFDRVEDSTDEDETAKQHGR
jgi:hypothetical protein